MLKGRAFCIAVVLGEQLILDVPKELKQVPSAVAGVLVVPVQPVPAGTNYQRGFLATHCTVA